MPPNVSDIPTPDILLSLAAVTLPPSTKYTNWSSTFRCWPAAIFEPENEYQCELILELAKRHRVEVRATGIGHSPSDIACTKGYLVRTLKLDRLLEVDVGNGHVVIEGGMTLDELHRHLDLHGLAMSNMGSISNQTIGGVTTVATHGTGLDYKVIPSYVLSMVILMANGTRATCSRSERCDLFLATLCGFGATGLVLRITLKVERAFRLREVQEVMPFSTALSQLHFLAKSAQHVRLWWFPSADRVVVGSFNRVYEPPDATQNSWLWDFFTLHIVQVCLLLGKVFQQLVPLAGRIALFLWFSQKPTTKIDMSHRVFNLDCKYRQYTTEWAIPYDQSECCLREVHVWLSKEQRDPQGLRPHFPIEVRFSDEDDIYLSPCYGRKTCWIGIIQHKPYGFPVPYRQLFHTFESIMSRHGGRPHWSKSHSLSPKDLHQLYPKFDDFLSVLETYDPKGTFRNEYVRRHIFGEDVGPRVFKDSSK